MKLIAMVLMAIVLAGCGQSATQKATANLSTSLDKLSMDDAYAAMLKDYDSPAKITVDLNRYGRSARAWAHDVGHEKAAKQLADDANSIQAVCADCAAWIDRIRATL